MAVVPLDQYASVLVAFDIDMQALLFRFARDFTSVGVYMSYFGVDGASNLMYFPVR